MLSWFAAKRLTVEAKCPPPAPVSQKSYCSIASPNGSLVVNRAEAAKVWPAVVRMLVTEFTTGPVSTGAVTVTLWDHGLHSLPSLTRTHSVSAPEPLWYVICANCAAET